MCYLFSIGRFQYSYSTSPLTAACSREWASFQENFRLISVIHWKANQFVSNSGFFCITAATTKALCSPTEWFARTTQTKLAGLQVRFLSPMIFALTANTSRMICSRPGSQQKGAEVNRDFELACHTSCLLTLTMVCVTAEQLLCRVASIINPCKLSNGKVQEAIGPQFSESKRACNTRWKFDGIC